jgi:hypothetical protein
VQQTETLFDQLVGGYKQSLRHGEAERLRGLEVDLISGQIGTEPDPERVALWLSACHDCVDRFYLTPAFLRPSMYVASWSGRFR